MSEEGQDEQSLMLSPLLQTHELRVACTSCYEHPHGIASTTTHICTQNILQARQRGDRDATWKHISPRPKFRNPARYVRCWYPVVGGRCLQYGEHCTYAKSDEEAAVWNFLKSSRLEYSVLIRLICKARGQENEKEELSVAKRVQSLFSGYFINLCHACLHSRPQRFTSECLTKVCGHPPYPALVLFWRQNDKVTVTEIRPIPPGLQVQQFRHCWHMERNGQCSAGCTFPHSKAEMVVWTAERNEGLNRHELVTTLEESKAQESPEKPQACFFCALCQLQLSSQDSFISHCSSLAHERRYCEDEGPAAEWKYRCPPEHNRAYELCDRPETCEYGENCTAAHSVEELQEWCLRKRMIRKRWRAVQDQDLLSYRDQLLMEYRESLNEVLIMAEDVEDVTVTCDKDLNVSSEKKTLTVKWTFTIDSERPLKAAALLKQEPGATFTLGDSTSKEPCVYAEGSRFCRLGTPYTLPVSFSSDCPGHYEQWLALDFDTRPVLLRKIRVGLGHKQSFSVAELTEDSSLSGCSATVAPLLLTERGTEPWHGGNRIIVPYQKRTEAETELLKEYKPPRLNPVFNPAAENDFPLTRRNYRESMHNFLYREELAQEEVLSRLCLQSVVVLLSDTITCLPYKMPVPFKKLYASVPLPNALTPHTVEGQLLRTAVGFALLARSTPVKKKVYEAQVLLEVSTEDTIYLLLSKACCSELGLRKDTSCPMDIQFQLNRVQFCEWHLAVDLLPDVERVLPNMIQGSIPEYSGEFLNPNLNAKQRAAMSLILGEATEQPSTAPVLIYGPFGTGKTFTLATAVMELLRQPNIRVLICTHTNSSADLYVKNHFHDYVERGYPEARPLRIKASKKGLSVRKTDNITLRYCLLSAEEDSFLFPKRSDLDSHRVVIITTSMARHLHDLKLPTDYFTHILIDEASQMLECSALIPLTLAGPRTRIILAGDHMQTGPKLFSVAQGCSSSEHTLLNRLFHYYQGQKGEAAARSRVIFSENYRCTKDIVDFIAAHFYFGKLDSNDVIRASGKVPPHPQFYPLRFHHIHGTCSWDKESMSWYNPEEAKLVVEIVAELLKAWPTIWGKTEQQSICILSQGCQIKLIRRELRKQKLGNVTVETVHNVQGKQFRVMVMTAVHTRDSLHSSDTTYPELFEDTRVLNTAMTRAQSQVVAVGDATALCYFGKCSTIWKSYIKQCINKGSVTPLHITIDHIKREVKEISKFHKAEESYDSDDQSFELELNKIEDPILQELLDEGRDVQVTISEEGLLEIIKKTVSGDTTACEEWSDTNIELLLRTRPNDFKRCKLIKETFDSGYAIPVDQPTLRISITGRENFGRSFPGDVAAVEILRDENTSLKGKVVGVLRGESQSRFVCAIDKYDPQVMTPINKGAFKIFTPFAKEKPNYVAVRKEENRSWISHRYIKINEDTRQNVLFVVKVLKWVDPCRYPLGIVTQVLKKAGSEAAGTEMLDIEYQLPEGPPKCNGNFKNSWKNREDFRKYTTFTIDRCKTQDLDDAFSARDLGDCYEIGVHITDVASFVTKGSEIDKFAENQGNVLYRLNGEPAFLFPKELREGSLSLLPKCDRHAISLMVVIEKRSNRIKGRNFALSQIKSQRRMTYKEADMIIQNHYVNYGDRLNFNTLEDCLAVSYHFSQVHKQHRVSVKWRKVQSDESVQQGKGMSHDMVEELMIMYNSFVSDFLISSEETHNLTPLRCQDCPDPRDISQFLARHSALMPFSAHLSHLQDESVEFYNENAEDISASEQKLGAAVETDQETERCNDPESFKEFSVFTSLLKRLEVAAQSRDFHSLVYLITADDMHPQLQPMAAEFRRLWQKGYILRSNSTAQSKIGHQDLQLDSYTWASSPMRRYMDVIVQRLLHLALEQSRPQVRYTTKEIDLFCALYMEKCKRKAEFDSDVQNLKTVMFLSNQSAQMMAVVNEWHPGRDNFQVSFPLNQITPSKLLSIKYKHLQLIDQPEYKNHSVILRWKRRVYSFTDSHICSKLEGVQVNPYITSIQPDAWKDIVLAIRAEDWEKVLRCIQEIKPSLSRGVKEGTGRLPDFQHYTNLSLELKVGQSLSVQLGTDTSRGRTFPAVQLVNINPHFDICLQHSKNPVMCFSNPAIQESKPQYSSYREYQQIWRQICAVETACNAVAENDSIVLEGVKISWKGERPECLEGHFRLSAEQKRQWSIECDVKNCFLCIRLRGQVGKGMEGLDLFAASPLQDLEEAQSFTWVAHGVTTKTTADKASKSLSYTQIDFRVNHLSMKDTPHTVFSEKTVFTVELLPKKIPLVLRERAIAHLARANELVKNITTGKTPSSASAVIGSNRENFGISDSRLPEFPKLNKSQNDAIKRALEMPFTLIQGPPGTGKTVVGVHIVYWFFMRNQEAQAADHITHGKKGSKRNGILYCGPSNKSVDIVAEQLLQFREVLKPLRVYSDQIEMLEFPYPGSRLKVCRKSLREEKPNEALRSITLRCLIRKADNPFSQQIKCFEGRIKGEGEIADDEIAGYRKLLNDARQYELKKHDIVLCTCSAAQDPNLVKIMNFRQILIDECSMATEAEALIPLVAHKPEQIVLIGDHKQMQPIVQCDLLKCMKKSLFERYQTKSYKDIATMLNIQYRMHEDICTFPSKTFYDGSLETDAKRETSVLLSPTTKPTSILFGHVDGQEETLVVSTEQGNENSTMNVAEAEQAVRLASLLISKSGIEPASIAILTPYNAQMSKINEMLSEKKITDVTVCTIMKSQGSEWRYVILSTVRSWPRSEIDDQLPRPNKAWQSKRLGFITDPNQVNVAITRAQDGLCILGNQHLLKCNALWEKLLDHYEKRECVVDPAKAIEVSPRKKTKTDRQK
ncbi:hypothetical protein GJAV_G00064290 [Gymnothorax javanicus]|nr:hypothetical protein GJAV_G00064290 [Gymnothorax javanicus]